MYRGLWRKGWVSGAFQNTGRKFMISQKIANSVKNAVSTVVLLMGAFFVCSTVLSMRAVLADPIAPVNTVVQTAQSPRNSGTVNRAPGRANPRGVANRATVARTTSNVAPARVNAQARPTTSARSVANRTVAGRAGNIASPRMVTTVQSPRTNAVSTRANTANARSVVSRSATTRAGATEQRAVRARNSANVVNASDAARISLQGSAIRGTKSSSGSTLSYLSNKLYTGNYSNIIDSTTGLISADAFNNCMESYYTCMDEICTARNQAQRRCACAGRVKTFADIEKSLESANEDLIKVSGELALLISSKGKDISAAFQLTDAEKVMNCVSWKEMSEKYASSTSKDDDKDGVDDATKWCQAHGFYDSNKCSASVKPEYCDESGNNFGFDVDSLGSTGSDILATLQGWADLKDQAISITTSDDANVLSAFQGVSSVVNGLVGIDGALTSSDDVKDSLAETWGYELFQYAHNNVCARVLDSCFNGIYEACGTPPTGTKCPDGKASCPYNYNSRIDVNNSGDYELDFVTGAGVANTTTSAVCFGYSSSTDPYSTLRGPVAEARRSIMQKYALDANADCDLYGEQLRATAQNINYQKVAAQQALQQKRLEFATENEEEVLTAAVDAGTNFNQCISELWECYTETAESESAWSTTRIKTYCAQIANVPSCYEEMICNPSTAQFKAVIDRPDSEKCFNSQDYKKNTCRNIVTLNEILNGASELKEYIDSEGEGDSAAMREACILDAGVGSLRSWTKNSSGNEQEECTATQLAGVHASAGYYDETNQKCVPTRCVAGYTWGEDGKTCEALQSVDCTKDIPNAKKATRTLQNDNTFGGCELIECNEHYTKTNNECVADSASCDSVALKYLNASEGKKVWNGTDWDECVATTCLLSNTSPTNGVCPSEKDCVAKDAVKAIQRVVNGVVGQCETIECRDGFTLVDGVCLKSALDCTDEIPNAHKAEKKLLTDGSYGKCMLSSCVRGYGWYNTNTTNVCYKHGDSCTTEVLNSMNATAGQWKLPIYEENASSKFVQCIPTMCKTGYKLSDNKCVADN